VVFVEGIFFPAIGSASRKVNSMRVSLTYSGDLCFLKVGMISMSEGGTERGIEISRVASVFNQISGLNFLQILSSSECFCH